MSATLDPRPVIGVERGWYIVALWNVLHLKFGVKLYSGIIRGRSDDRSFIEVVSSRWSRLSVCLFMLVVGTFICTQLVR